MTRIIRTLLGGITLAASGAYTFVYLYRWEWNRALMSAAIFIAAEVAVMGSLLAQRLKVVSERLDAVETRPEPRVVRLERIRTSAPPARKTFAWLAKPEQMNVFVPVLMGAGVLLSGLAWLVERIARATVTPVAERGLAAQLDGLALPAHGFATAEPRAARPAAGPDGSGPVRTVGLAVLAVLTIFGVIALADLTQNRPDPVVEGSSTTVDFDVATRRYSGSELLAAQSLWAVCQSTVGGEKTAVTEVGDHFSVTVSPAFGENGRKRLTGCIEDATVDRVMGHVVSLSNAVA